MPVQTPPLNTPESVLMQNPASANAPLRASRRLLPLLAALLMSVLTLVGCAGQIKTSAPQTAVDEAMVEKAISSLARISEFKGFGEITMVSSGQKMTGKFDALRKNTGFFNAQVYSPFGSAVASIEAEDFKGRVSAGKERIDFTYDNKMERVPFPCVRHFTYGKFVNVLTASMPDEFWELSASPHTLAQSKKKKKTTTVAWASSTLSLRAEIVPKTGQFQSVLFDYNIDGSKLTIQFSRFRKGVPYEIHVRETNKNNITVKYESITWK